MRTLRNAVASRKVSHAYLFSGPRGTGKTSSGRLLAKAGNCRDPQDGEPCNKCDSCLRFLRGTRHGPRRARRRQQPRHRRDTQPAREGRLRARQRRLQSLHHRRSAHAHRARLQRPPEDARRAAAARHLRPGDDRAAQDTGDHRLPLPAIRLPPHPPRAGHRPAGLRLRAGGDSLPARGAGAHRPHRHRQHARRHQSAGAGGRLPRPRADASRRSRAASASAATPAAAIWRASSCAATSAAAWPSSPPSATTASTCASSSARSSPTCDSSCWWPPAPTAPSA